MLLTRTSWTFRLITNGTTLVPSVTEPLLKQLDGPPVAHAQAELAGFTLEKWDQHWQFIFGGQKFG